MKSKHIYKKVGEQLFKKLLLTHMNSSQIIANVISYINGHKNLSNIIKEKDNRFLLVFSMNCFLRHSAETLPLLKPYVKCQCFIYLIPSMVFYEGEPEGGRVEVPTNTRPGRIKTFLTNWHHFQSFLWKEGQINFWLSGVFISNSSRWNK